MTIKEQVARELGEYAFNKPWGELSTYEKNSANNKATILLLPVLSKFKEIVGGMTKVEGNPYLEHFEELAEKYPSRAARDEEHIKQLAKIFERGTEAQLHHDQQEILNKLEEM